MWLVFSIFLVLWLLSVQLHFPLLLILLFLAAVLLSAGLAMLPVRQVEE